MIYYSPDYLCHYGVLGMKWGRRKSSYESPVSVKRTAYKQAKKDYNKSFNTAYNKAAAAYSPIKKHRQANEDRWKDVADKAETLKTAKGEYKQAKAARKEQIKSTYKEINKNASLGDKLIYNNATRKAAAKYVVDKNMSIEQATKKANQKAVRNTMAFMAAYGGITIATLYKMNN